MLRELFALIVEASSYQWSGKLGVTNTVAGLEWQLFFEMGRLVWVEGGAHPRRRYHRHFKARGFAPKRAEIDTTSNRLRATILAIQSGQLDPECLQSWLKAAAREVFFDISQACSSSLRRGSHGQFAWHKNERPNREFVMPASWGIDACLAFKYGRRDWREWKTAGLIRWSPDLSPTIASEYLLATTLPPKAVKHATQLFTRGRTIRDVAARTHKRPKSVAAALLPFLRRGSMTFETRPDLGRGEVPGALGYLLALGAPAANSPDFSEVAIDEDPTAPPVAAPDYMEDSVARPLAGLDPLEDITAPAAEPDPRKRTRNVMTPSDDAEAAVGLARLLDLDTRAFSATTRFVPLRA